MPIRIVLLVVPGIAWHLMYSTHLLLLMQLVVLVAHRHLHNDRIGLLDDFASVNGSMHCAKTGSLTLATTDRLVALLLFVHVVFHLCPASAPLTNTLPATIPNVLCSDDAVP